MSGDREAGRWRSAGIAAMLAGLLAIGAVALRANARDRRARAQAAELVARLDQRRASLPTTREALYGATVEGSAWAHYERALGLVQALGSDLDGRAAAATRASSPEERRLRDELLEAAGPALAELKLGAHASETSRPQALALVEEPEWPSGISMSGARALVNLALADLVRGTEEGETREGVFAVLDAMQFARDAGDSPLGMDALIGGSFGIPPTLPAACERGLLDALEPSSAEAWLRGLEGLDWSAERLPPALFTTLADFGRTAEELHSSDLEYLGWSEWELEFRWTDAVTGRAPLVELFLVLGERALAMGEAPGDAGIGWYPGEGSPVSSALIDSWRTDNLVLATRARTRAQIALLRGALQLELGLEPDWGGLELEYPMRVEEVPGGHRLEIDVMDGGSVELVTRDQGAE